MQIITTKQALREELEARRQRGKVILVPTMGALHVGHFSLFDAARVIAGAEGTVVSSVFVNPIQFNNQGDLASYPRTWESDMAGCEEHGVDIVFSPTPEEMYAADRSISIEETSLSSFLCGASRPGHFAGVCTVVAKLFNIVMPTDALFGKKDYQQLAIIRRLVRDLDISVRIHGVEIVRQADGLACSSRNARLSPALKLEATVLYRALQKAHKQFIEGDACASHLIESARSLIEQSPHAVIDYIGLWDSETMQPVETIHRLAVMALAVEFGGVRLIDNLEF